MSRAYSLHSGSCCATDFAAAGRATQSLVRSPNPAGVHDRIGDAEVKASVVYLSRIVGVPVVFANCIRREAHDLLAAQIFQTHRFAVLISCFECGRSGSFFDHVCPLDRMLRWSKLIVEDQGHNHESFNQE